MVAPTIRPAFPKWPVFNDQLRDTVATLTEEQLATHPSPERWPMWATIGHLACQRVYWLCDAVGEPGADTTPFTEAGSNCPGDDDLEHVLGAAELADALDSTFRIVEDRLDSWTFDSLQDEIRRPEWGPDWVYTRGGILQRVFAHDVYHGAELNEMLARAGLPEMRFWDW
jgi:DinB family protein